MEIHTGYVPPDTVAEKRSTGLFYEALSSR
jgi:hypothetical protein